MATYLQDARREPAFNPYRESRTDYFAGLRLDATAPHLRPLITQPRSNVVFNIVYYATGADVDSSVIDGRVVMEKREVLTIDETEVLSSLQRRAQSLWERAGVG